MGRRLQVARFHRVKSRQPDEGAAVTGTYVRQLWAARACFPDKALKQEASGRAPSHRQCSNEEIVLIASRDGSAKVHPASMNPNSATASMTESPICTWPAGRTGAKTPRATPIESNRSVTQPGAEGTAFRSWLQAAPRRAVAGRCRECPPPLKGAH